MGIKVDQWWVYITLIYKINHTAGDNYIYTIIIIVLTESVQSF